MVNKLAALAAAVVVTGLAGAVAGTGPNQAPVEATTDSSTTLKYARKAFSGQIEVERPDYPEHLDKYPSTKKTFYAAVDECLAGRKVELFKSVRTKKGRLLIEVDDTRSDDSGAWSIPRARAHGRFKAVVKGKRVDTLASDPSYGVIVVCSGDDTKLLRASR
jgi:hypothetical protein